MTPADNTPDSASISKSGLLESDIEKAFIAQLGDLKYTIRRDIRDETSLHNNFREKFEALNRVRLTDAEFNRGRAWDEENARRSRRGSGFAPTGPASSRTETHQIRWMQIDHQVGPLLGSRYS